MVGGPRKKSGKDTSDAWNQDEGRLASSKRGVKHPYNREKILKRWGGNFQKEIIPH